MAFKPFDEETTDVIKQLQQLKSEFTSECPKSRIQFITLVFRYDLYDEISSNELVESFDISGRDFDNCIETQDSDLVIHGLIQNSYKELIIKWNISSLGRYVWESWHDTYLKVSNSQPA